LEAERSDLVEAATLELFGAALFEIGWTQFLVGGAFSQQMVGDVQDMAADCEGSILAVVTRFILLLSADAYAMQLCKQGLVEDRQPLNEPTIP